MNFFSKSKHDLDTLDRQFIFFIYLFLNYVGAEIHFYVLFRSVSFATPTSKNQPHAKSNVERT